MESEERHPIEIGRRIRDARRGRSLTLVQLEKITGVDNATISRMENGFFPKNKENLEKVAKALNLNFKAIQLATPEVDQKRALLILINSSKIRNLILDFSSNTVTFSFEKKKLETPEADQTI